MGTYIDEKGVRKVAFSCSTDPKFDNFFFRSCLSYRFRRTGILAISALGLEFRGVERFPAA
jgi:hypothetical protein